MPVYKSSNFATVIDEYQGVSVRITKLSGKYNGLIESAPEKGV
jgi:hypothetical protein